MLYDHYISIKLEGKHIRGEDEVGVGGPDGEISTSKGGKITQIWEISGMAGKEKQQRMFLEGSITQMMRMDLEKVAEEEY